MRQRRLPILVAIFIGVLALVIFRLYCKGTYQRENQDNRDLQETPSKSNTVLADKPGSDNKPGKSTDAGDNGESTRSKNKTGQHSATSDEETGNRSEPTFNRDLTKIIYSRHARCRMDCRRIDESEVIEIREEGKINFDKSELNSKRDPKFALEGITHDKQHVRIVFAQTAEAHVVVTCIDLDTDWACSCN
jgi:hypothetical protein